MLFWISKLFTFKPSVQIIKISTVVLLTSRSSKLHLIRICFDEFFLKQLYYEKASLKYKHDFSFVQFAFSWHNCFFKYTNKFLKSFSRHYNDWYESNYISFLSTKSILNFADMFYIAIFISQIVFRDISYFFLIILNWLVHLIKAIIINLWTLLFIQNNSSLADPFYQNKVLTTNWLFVIKGCFLKYLKTTFYYKVVFLPQK